MKIERMNTVLVLHPNPSFKQILISAHRENVRLVIVPRPGQGNLWSELDSHVIEAVVELPLPHHEDFETELELLAAGRAVNGIVGLYEASVQACASVSARLGLATVPPDVVAKVRDKSQMQGGLASAGLRVPTHIRSSLESLISNSSNLKYPVVVKPLDGFSSTGVIRVDKVDELRGAAISTLSAASELGVSDDAVLVEEFIEGDEFVVEALSWNGATFILGVGYKGRPAGPFFEETIYEMPADLNESDLERVVLIVKAAHRALGIDHGITHTELRLDSEGVPYVFDIGARIGGSGVSHVLIGGATGVDLFGEAMRLSLGMEPRTTRDTYDGLEGAVGNYIIPTSGYGTVLNIVGMEEVSRMGQVIQVIQFANRGDVIKPYPHFSGYPGFVMSKHNTLQELRQFHCFLARAVRVVYS